MAFGAKIKLTVNKSGSSTFRTEIQRYVDDAVRANPVKINIQFKISNPKTQLTSLTSQLNQAGGITNVKLSNIDAGGAISKLRSDIQRMLEGLSVVGLKDFLKADGIDDVVSGVDEAKRDASEWAAQMQMIKNISTKLATTYKSGLSGTKMISESAEFPDISARYAEWQQKVEQLRTAKAALSQDEMKDLQDEGIAIQQKITLLQRESAENMKRAAAQKKAADAEGAATKKSLNVDRQVIALKAQVQRWIISNGKAYGKYGDSIDSIMAELQGGGKLSEEDLIRLRLRFGEIDAEARAAGLSGNTFFTTMKNGLKKFGGWSLITRSLMAVYRVFKDMIAAVRELDTAMTELKKVTDLTELSYDRYLNTATKISQAIGATLVDTVNATADFAKLGYNILDASMLSEAALIYKNVGDGITDISEASESLISTIKAFGIEAQDAMSIVDKFNEVGNNFAISSRGIGDALQRSASSLAAANNTLEEGIALATGMNSVLQDPEKVGTALKTITMFLRAAKTEAEEAGESTDGMANSVSELRGQLLKLTNNRVDIMVDDTTYKSTYQIMKELSQVWNSLTDIDVANIVELIGGKRNANAITALVTNFGDAEAALQTALSASGSAFAENEKYLNSIEGKIKVLKATFEELSTNLVDSQFLKDVIEFGTGLLNLLKTMPSLINSLGGLKTILFAISGTIVTIKIDAIKKSLLNLAKPLTKIISLFSNFRNNFALFVDGMNNAAPGTSKLSAGLKAIGISASGAQIAVAALTIAITIGLAIYNKHKQKIEEQMNAARDATASLNETNKSIEEYIQKATELRGALDTGNMSESDAYDARKQLVEIEQSLIELLGKEAEGINLVTGNIKQQIDALDGLSKAKWEQYEEENKGAIIGATDVITGDSYAPIISLSPHTNKKFRDALIQKISGVLGDVDIFNDSFGTTSMLTLPQANNIYELKDAYESVYKIIKQVGAEFYSGQEYDDFIESTLSGLSDQIREVNADIEENEEIFNAYTEGLLRYDKTYSEIYGMVLTAQKEYDGAIQSGDNQAIDNAVRKMKEAEAAFLAAGWDNEAVTIYMNEFFDRFKAVSRDRVLRAELELVLKNPQSDIVKKLKNAVEAFENENGEIDISTVLNYGITLGDLVEDNAPIGLDKYIAWENLSSIAEGYGVTIEELMTIMVDLDLVTLKTASDIEESTISFEAGMSKIQKLSAGFGLLDKIYADVSNGEYFDWSSILNNEDFTEVFGSLGDSYTGFMKTVSENSSDIDACRSAFDDLATAYLSNSSALDNLTTENEKAAVAMLKQMGISNAETLVLMRSGTALENLAEENRDATIATLEQMGVSNAASVVYAQLAYNKEKLKYSTEEYTSKTYEEIAALCATQEAGSAAQQAFAELAIQKTLVHKNAIRTSSDIDQLIALANAARATTATLEDLSKAKFLMSQVDQVDANIEKAKANGWTDRLSGYYLAKDTYLKNIQAILDKPLKYNEISPDAFRALYAGGEAAEDQAKKAEKEAEKSAEKEKTWFEKEYSTHQHLINMNKESYSDYYSWLENASGRAYKEGILELDDYRKYVEEVYGGLHEVFKDHLSDAEHDVSMREGVEGESKNIINIYKGLISDVDAELKRAYAQGLDEHDDYVQELLSKEKSYGDDIKDIQDEIVDNAKDALDELVEYQTDMLKQEVEEQKDVLDKKLDNLKEFYDRQKEMLQDKYDEEKYLEEQSEKRKAVSDIQAQLAQLEFDDSAWSQKRKAELKEELINAQNEIGDFESEHALSLALDVLDSSYDEQEKQIQSQIEALDAELNDPAALFNKALIAIQTNTGGLYQQMLEYNREHGTGNDADVDEVWKEASESFKNYEDVYGSSYNGVSAAKLVKNQLNTGGNMLGDIDGDGRITAADSRLVRRAAVGLEKLTDGQKLAADIDGDGDITSEDVRLILRKIAGLDKGGGYAGGTSSATAGIHKIDELGDETIFTSADGSKYRMFSGGEKVLNANASKFLYDFANGGYNMLKRIIHSTFGRSFVGKVSPIAMSNEINMGDIIVEGNADSHTVSEVRRVQRESVEYMLKEFARLKG